MARRFKYSSYLFALCLAVSLSATAQYSEQDLRKEANDYFYDQLYAKAMPLFSQLLSLDPTNAEYNYKYGATALYGDADKKEEAIKFLRFASTNGGIENECWYFLGRAFHLNYRFADAIQAYEKYTSLASSKDAERLEIARHIESCRSGLNLLSKIKDVVVLEKKQTLEDAFFRIYNLSEIGGKILVTPEALLTREDQKRNHRSIIHFRGAGSTVYFSSYGDKGEDGLDIYRAEVLPDGEFTTPVKLGPAINTKYDEDFPFFHSDNKTLYFSSKGHGSMGGYDIFKSITSPGSGTFSQPENLDFAVNTPDDDLFYIADSTKNLANFASARSSKQGELHVYTVKVKSAPVDLTLIKGEFVNRINPSNSLSKITVIDAATNRTVETQFTDPKTGDYVLSIPKSGKYKFLVEVDNSDRVHSGVVEVPKSSGVKAYLQEMELISSAGVEKLVINNLFDQSYDGDVMALAQDILKQKASLEVNFNASEDEPKEEPKTEEQDFAQAYVDAGFSAGLTNEKVLNQASKRSSELKSNLSEMQLMRAGASEVYRTKVAEANEFMSTAEKRISDAETATGEERRRLMFKAGVAKMNAQRAIEESRSAENLIAKIAELEAKMQVRIDSAKTHENKLKDALAAEDYDTAVAVMKREAEIGSENSTAFQPIDPEEILQASQRELKAEAESQSSRSISLRETVESMQAELTTKKRQLENAKKSEAKELSAEIARLEMDIEDADLNVSRAFERADEEHKKASDAERQITMLQDLMASNSEMPEDERAETLDLPLKTARRNEIAEKASNLDIDGAAVADYIDANPWAAKVFESDQVAMRFKKEYGASVDEDSELASAKNPVNGQTEGESEKPVESVGEDATTLSDSSTAAASEREPVHDDSTGSELATAQETKEFDVDSVDEAKPEEPDIAIAEDDVKDADLTADTGKPSDKESGKTGVADAEKRVKAEEVKIQAARDWLEIIDTSIAELESGVGGNEETEEEDVAAQLDEYRRLRKEKLNEIAKSESLIAELDETKKPESESGNLDALSRAQQDVDELDSGQIAQLESKIPRASQDVEYISVVREIDRDYLPELVSIELSGRSAPELARDRKKLNEEFIARLDQFLEGEAPSEIDREDLLQMRRIKYLEIVQDERVMLGSEAYIPRTSEAQEYAALITDSAEVETGNDQKEETFEGISPELAADLQSPYRKNLVLDNYEAELLDLGNEENDSLKLAKRIALNEKFLRSLSSEIQLYAAAMESTSGESERAVSQRYNVLLTERSAVVDEINTDKEILSSETELEPIALETRESDTVDVESTDSPEDSGGLVDNAENIIAAIEKSYAEKLSAIDDSKMDKSARLKQKADLNFNIAQEIDSIINVQVAALDRSTADEERNALQQNIQELESIAADKRQEADRFMFESDEPELADSKSGEEKTSEQLTPESKAEKSGELEVEKVLESLPKMEFGELKYVSLNANVTYNTVKPGLDSAKVIRRDLEEKIEAYQTEREADEKRSLAVSIMALKSDLIEKEKRITREIAESNQAELKYFRNSNRALIRQLEVIGLTDGSDEEITAYKAAKFEIAKRLEELDYQQNENLSLEERIVKEQEIIADMAALYHSMDAEIERAERQDSLLSENGREDEAVEMEGRLSAYETLLEEPENLKPELGRNYVAPIHTKVAAQLTDTRKAELRRNTPILNFETDFPDETDEVELKSMVSKTTPVDDRGFELLQSKPAQLKFLVSALQADSLKQMELASKDYADQRSKGAKEKYVEVNRLRNMASHEDNLKSKEIILKRASAMEAEAQTNLEKAALSSYQAEALRKKRKEEEEKLGQLASNLSPLEIAETRSLIDNITYKIIPSDLATEDLAEKPEKIDEKPAMATMPEDDTKAETTTAESEKATPESINAKRDMRINSADEDNLLNAAGSWLAMVEIIAERDDFSDVEESLFIETDESVYSERKPIPINPALPKGLYFQVQIGAFRNPIPQDLYGEIAPVMGEKLGNGITRYRAGIFKNYGAAVSSRDIIRSKGYSDAFVVAYVDGERLTGSQAQEILRQLRNMDTEALADGEVTDKSTQKELDPIQTEGAPDLTTNPATTERSADYYNDPEAAEAKQVEVTPGLFYTVQVGVYSKPVKLAELFNLSDLNTELTASGYVRYTTGRYGNIDEARSRKDAAVGKGVTDAFITAYYNGKRISVAEAQEILDKEGDSAISPEVSGGTSSPDSGSEEAVDSEKSYIVILGSFGGDIPQSLADLFLENPNWEIKKVEGPNNQSMYITSDFESKDEASEFLRIARDSGVSSAILGELTNGKISAVGTD